jgi:sugar phosphate isomerase/epimerase
MQVGFFSAIFHDQPIEDVSDWAAKYGFESIEIDFRNHIRTPAETGKVVGYVRDSGLGISSIALIGSLLDSNVQAERRHRELARELLSAAAAASVPAVVLFPGRNESLSEDENYWNLAGYLESLANETSSAKTKVLLENWPGIHRNSVATTPEGWQKLFELVPSVRVGLEFDPSHLLFQGIDVQRAIADATGRVVLVHAKDAELYPDRVQKCGYFGAWWAYRLPGRGQLDWSKFVKSLKAIGYDDALIIEHEDSEYGWKGGPLDLRRAGLVHAHETLRLKINEAEFTELTDNEGVT